jgi:hypothetical protein
LFLARWSGGASGPRLAVTSAGPLRGDGILTKIRTSDEVLDVRTKAAIGKYMKQIRAQIVKEAQAQGHHIKDQNIKSVTYQGLSDVSYEFSDLDLGDFVITDPESLLFLDKTEWDNNSAQTPTVTLTVDERSEDTYSWEISAGVTIKYETRTEARIYAPAGGSITSSWSFQFDFTVTRGTAHRSARGWKEFSQPVSPYSHTALTVYGVQFVGYSPFKVTAFASGKAKLEIKIDYWGSRTRNVKVDLARILSREERAFVSKGRINGIQGYKWDPKTVERPLNAEERAALPQGLVGGRTDNGLLGLPEAA